MKDRQRFADKLSHYQLRKGALALIARRISRCSDSAVPHCALGHPGATQDQATGFLYLTHDFICALCCLSAFTHYGFILMSQKNPESKAMRNQQQRHNDSRNEVSRSQLPRQQPGMIGLVESI